MREKKIFPKMGVFLESYMSVWKRLIYDLVKRICVFLEPYIGVWKRLHMRVCKLLYTGVSQTVHMGVS